MGYQAAGTLGRVLLEGAPQVKLFGETIEVQAELCQLTGMSGHADREGLLRWIEAFDTKPKRVFVNHGEDEVEDRFVQLLQGWIEAFDTKPKRVFVNHGEDEVEDRFVQLLQERGFTACAPYNGAQWVLGAEGAVCVQEGSREKVQRRTGTEGPSRAASVRLVNAGRRLLRVIEHNQGGANKDLARFADQINALCDKWDR